MVARVCYILHDDSSYLAQSIHSFRDAGEVFAFVSRVPWHDTPGDWETAVRVAEATGATVVLGEWRSELEHQQFALGYLRERGFTHALIPDGDEIIKPGLLRTLVKIAEGELADRVYVHWDTYWKTPEYVIRPREGFTPCMLLDLRVAEPVGGRNFSGGRSLLLGPEYGLVHHLSYVGPDSRIRRKITTWGHKDEVQPGWWEQTWQAWDGDKLLRDLHPTHPPAYGFAERIAVPDILVPAWQQYKKAEEEKSRQGEAETNLPVLARWPRVSVVIPVHGGREDLRLCLDSLDACRDLLHEVVVVDNASPDDALEEAEKREGVRLVCNQTNTGFAHACNQGREATTGDLVLFLNSDTVVPQPALVRLVESLLRSGTIAAAGPFTNRAGHGQQLAPTYTSLATLSLFAHDFAHRPQEDADTDMLVGFCLAVRRSALEEVGGFDERFGLGMFEDNDLCYRLRRAGYRLVRSARSFVHHGGSQTFGRMQVDMTALLAHNERLFRQKWQEDLDSGYASHLAGLAVAPLRFDPARHPDLERKRIEELARRADISLCMIVKDEERVLGDCLQSARPFFPQRIVVDTGSSDRTVEIAHETGAQVYDFPWTESFSEARNESLKYATGKWIFWMDADDTLPLGAGEAILNAALSAPESIVGFVIPVQFVDDGRGAAGAGGTRVDHVKLFRNLPGLQFEGRIHEQILPTLRATGGQIARCNALVLHSGYDTSPSGQAKKRIRDARLLELELQERPDHPFVLFCLGMTDHYGGEQATAVEWLRKSIARSGEGDSHLRKAYALLAVSLRQLNRIAESEAALREGLGVTPDDPELHFHLGHLLTQTGDYAHAREHYEQALQADIAGHYSSVDVGILGYKTLHNLGGLALLQGDYPQARRRFEEAITAAPDFLPSAFSLFEAALTFHDYATAQKMLETVREREGPDGQWATLGQQYARQIGGEENAVLFLQQAMQQYPHATAPRLLVARHLLEQERTTEALPHLHHLAQQNVAEAAYCLGVAAIRAGQLEAALGHMERALALNPDHAQTQEQVAFLRRALGQDHGKSGIVTADAANPDDGNDIPSVSLEEGLGLLAAYFGLDAGELLAYAEEDLVGGYGKGNSPDNSPRWPGGSVWEAEGRTLYALVRALKPQTIVEVGSLVGCSTSHLALACQRNGQGHVYAVDPAGDFARVDPDLRPFYTLIQQDVFAWTPPDAIDFVFEDGAHTPGFTGSVLRHLLPSLAPAAAVLCHDACHRELGGHIYAELRDVLGEDAGRFLLAPSDCGLGYAHYRVVPNLSLLNCVMEISTWQ